jgi:hypothetical protein
MNKTLHRTAKTPRRFELNKRRLEEELDCANVDCVIEKSSDSLMLRCLQLRTHLMVILYTLIVIPLCFQFCEGNAQAQKNMSPEKLPSVTGDWKLEVTDNGKKFSSVLRLQQDKVNYFVGEGKDTAGPFYVVGSMRLPDQIAFNKYYRRPDGTCEKPVVYHGAFDLTRETPLAKGDWVSTWREGAFKNAGVKSKTGFWVAERTRSATHVKVSPADKDMSPPPLDKN